MRILITALSLCLIAVCAIMYSTLAVHPSNIELDKAYSSDLKRLNDILESIPYTQRRIQWNIEVDRCKDRKTFPERRDCRRSMLKLIPVVPHFSERMLNMTNIDMSMIHRQNIEDFMSFGKGYEGDASIDCSHCKL